MIVEYKCGVVRIIYTGAKKKATLSVENFKMVINQQKLIIFNYHYDLEILNNISDKSTPLQKHISWSYCWVYIYGGGLVDKLCLILATPWTVPHPGSSVHGIFQARILEWVAISFSRPICFFSIF